MKPNILLIMTDQMRGDAIGPNGDWVKTPAMDQLSKNGVTFTNCFTNSPVCFPARVSLATGQYPHNTGVWRNLRWYDLPDNTSTFMQTIQKAGYQTALIGKAHLHHQEGDLRDRENLMRKLGFDYINEIAGPRASTHVRSYMTEEWEKSGIWKAYQADFRERFSRKPYIARPSALPLEHYYDVYVGKKAKEFIANYEGNQPWFCQIGFSGPHEPWDAPEPYASMYDPSDMPVAINRESFKDSPIRPKGNLDDLWNEGDPHSPPLTESEIAQMRANYAGNLTLIDEQIGQILTALKEKNMFDSTIIIFCSDHGEMNGDFGLIYKENFFNSSVNVPLIISTPKLRCNVENEITCHEMVELLDLGPTMCELAGGAIDYQQFGQSLTEMIRKYEKGEGPGSSHREEAMAEHKGEIMLSTKEWKVVFNQQGEAYLLFHLTSDPYEQINRVEDPECKQIIASFYTRLCKRMVKSQTYLHHQQPDVAGIDHLFSVN